MCVSSITKADSAEIPSYLDLTTWKCNNNLKVCQSHQAIEPKQSIELFETDTGCSGPKLVPEAPSTESISSQSGCPESDSSLVTLFGVDDSNPSSFEDDERDTDSYDDSTTSNDDQSFRSTVLSEERK